MNSNKCIKIIALCLLLVISGKAQELKEGVVNVLIREDFAKQKLHSAYKDKGKDMVNLLHPMANKIFSKYKVTKFERTFPGIEKYDHPHVKILSRYYTIEGNFKRDRIIYDIIKEGEELFEDIEPLGVENPLFTPNDYELKPLTNANLDLVNAKQAWNISKGSRSIKAAVTDPWGFWLNNPDYVNSNGTNQILYASPGAANEVYSSNGGRAHGLEVASVLAMATNNNVGMSAIGYNTGLMVFASGVSNMLSASLDHNADIVEASWRGGCTYKASEQLIMDMIHDNGSVIVVAAGNGNRGTSCPSPDGEGNGLLYPASYNHVISVGGVDTFYPDKYTQYSQGILYHHTFNAAVDLTAPAWGVGIATVWLNADLTFDEYRYSSGGGTSYAAPMVAGLAGLILAMKPDLSPEEVEFVLKSTAVNVDNLPGNEVYAGLAGAGRIDAYAAVLKTYTCYTCEDVYYLPEQIPDEPPFIPTIAQGCKIEIADHVTFSGENYEVRASKQIRLLPGFTALQGCNVQFKINEDCIVPSSSGARSRTSEIQHVSYRDLIESGKIQIPEPRELSVEETSGWEDGLGIYPNPAKDKTIIKYNLEQSSHVKLQLHNVTGNSIETIIDGFQEEGQREVSHNVSEIAPGIYYYLLETNRARKMVRFVVIH